MRVAYQAFISVFLLAVIGLQAAASLGLTHPSYLWPFLNYPMYATPHRLGDAVPVYTLVGIREDGRETPISFSDMNLNRWQFMKGPVEDIRKGDAGAMRLYLAELEARRGEHYRALRLENRAVTLTSGGTAAAPVETVTLDLGNRAP